MYLMLIKISLIAFMFVQMGEPDMIFSWYQRLIGKLPHWLNAPLGGCLWCFTGQVCFWSYIIIYHAEYNIINHLFFTSLGIFASSIYDKIWNYE